MRGRLKPRSGNTTRRWSSWGWVSGVVCTRRTCLHTHINTRTRFIMKTRIEIILFITLFFPLKTFLTYHERNLLINISCKIISKFVLPYHESNLLINISCKIISKFVLPYHESNSLINISCKIISKFLLPYHESN